ncbi:RING finger protein 223 [Triplophysa rosa]|uniref:RING finger protein 223 n=1 Tax=Triplophysa rosa TaxID=992332 RepID=A0A9W7TCU4_TRIRA|nr:RING finger protein 223 [Triplophysa rosa]KAI7794123.1 putative RING finger protein 223 [Triplophysa rosa]
MEPSPVVWHTQVVPRDFDLERASSQPECSICFNIYDNVFKTPKQLDCTHTFCLECISRIMATSMDPQNSQISCPFCRHHTVIPKKGPPALTTSQEVLCRLPVHQQHEESVWLDGERLCYQQPIGKPGMQAFCICLDIGANGQGGVSSPQTRPRLGFFERLMDWKRLLLFIFLMVLLMVIILWPLQCIVTTGSMRCAPQHLRPSTTTTTVSTTTMTTTTTTPN